RPKEGRTMPRRSICANLRAIATVLVFFAALAFTGTGHAQSPVFPAVDGNGVDITMGAFTLSHADVVVGQPGKGGLALVRYQSWTGPNGGWTHNHIGYLTSSGPSGLTCVVAIGTFTETFTTTSPGCTGSFSSDQQRGASMTGGNGLYTYTSGDGLV